MGIEWGLYDGGALVRERPKLGISRERVALKIPARPLGLQLSFIALIFFSLSFALVLLQPVLQGEIEYGEQYSDETMGYLFEKVL